MRRVSLFVAAMIAVLTSAPAQARAFLFDYSANVVGTQTVYDPTLPFCSTNPLGCLGSAPFQATISGSTTLFNDTGTGQFEFGNFCANCTGWTGTIVGGLVDGFPEFSGINFVYTVANPSILGAVRATAPTFSVRLISVDGIPPLPEPETWLSIILGFGAIGGALRRRRFQQLPAPARI